MTSVFAKYEQKFYPYQYEGALRVFDLFGGTPTDPKVAEGFLKSKLAASDDLIREAVAEVMLERGVSVQEAVEQVNISKHLNGFKRDETTGELYIEGRQLKAALKEAASVAANENKIPTGKAWGSTNKGLIGWFPEHVFVIERRLHLGVKEPSGINQDFVHTFRGSGIQYNEFIDQADIDFHIETDHQFTDEQWAAIWLTGQRQGLGASRSQGRGRYEVIRWQPVTPKRKRAA